jgi:DNA-binding FadR family transcriptional regulator
MTHDIASELSGAFAPASGSTLTQNVVERLRRVIREAKLAPGERLPSERVLTSSMDVSRTVLREAIAQLRAEGLLVSRRGSGVYTAEAPPPHPFRVVKEDIDKAATTVSLLELRAGVEIEAAALAAMRRTADNLVKIENALERMAGYGGVDRTGIAADYDFHLSVAAATQNNHFVDFLSYLGKIIIPRQAVRIQVDPTTAMEGYIAMLIREHREILSAIRVRDSHAAKEAMGTHLYGAAERYRRWAVEETNRAPDD